MEDLRKVYDWIGCLQPEVLKRRQGYDWFLKRDVTKTLEQLMHARPHMSGTAG